jgi:CubicO group peptidase (beta-lactamase class C family)
LPPRPLPTSRPALQHVDAHRIAAFLDAVETTPGIEPHSLMILRHGKLVASGWWAPFTPGRPHHLYSLSKSFTSTAAGFAVAEGLLDLDAPVISYFPELDEATTDPRTRAILVRHLATMATGHLDDTWGPALALDQEDPVRGFLRIPPERDPGTVFAYNQPATYTLGAIIQRLTGGSLTDYLRPRLFDPLGTGVAAWQQYPAGRDLGFSGLHATTDAVARLGQLYLDGGVWEGRQLLPAGWVEEATRRHIGTAGFQDGPKPDWHQGYGFQFWQARHGYRGDGAYGQYCIVLPEQDAVIAMTSAVQDMQTFMDAVWEHLLPAFGSAPLDGAEADAEADADADAEAADAALRTRLALLELPHVTAQSAPTVDPADWKDTTFAPAGGVCEAQPSLTAVTVTSYDGGWTLTLTETAATTGTETGIQLRLSGDDIRNRTGWTVDAGPGSPVPTAVSGGWTTAGKAGLVAEPVAEPEAEVLTADVLFLETPHRLTVTCTLADRTFTARWHTTPLQEGRLIRLQAP